MKPQWPWSDLDAHKSMRSPWTFTLWPPTSNQFIFESKWMFVPNFKDIFSRSCMFLRCLYSQDQQWDFKGHCDLDLSPGHCNQFILEHNWIFVLNLKRFSGCIPEVHKAKHLSCKVRATLPFEFWQPESSQFILESNWKFVVWAEL